MKTWIKRILIGLAIVVIAAIAGLAVFLLTFDPNAYKYKLEELVQQRYHRTLTIDGDIEMSLFPRIGLTLQGVSLSEPGNADIFASIDSARMSVAIWPLLSNMLVVDHLTISGFKAHVVRDKQGRFNFHDLMAQHAHLAQQPEGAADAAAGGAAGPAPDNAVAAGPAADSVVVANAAGRDMQVDIAGLDIKDGELQLQDEMSGMAVAVTQFNATTGRVTFGQPFDVSMSARLQGGDPRIDAGLTGQALLTLDPTKDHYSAQRMDLRMDGQLPRAQAKSLAARGNLAYNGSTGKLDIAGLEVVFQGDWQNPARPVTNMEASIAMPKLLIDPHKRELQIEKLAVRAKGALPQGPFELAVDAPALKISPLSATGAALTGRFRLDGADGMDASFGLTGISGNVAQLDVNEVKVNGVFKQGARTVTVGAVTPLSLNLQDRAAALQALRGDVTITDAALPKGSLQIPIIGSINADLGKDVANAQLNAVLEGGRFDLTADVAQLSSVPAVKFALAVDTLDLDKLAPPRGAAAAPVKPADAGNAKADAATAKPAPAAPAASADDGAIDLSALVGPSADGTIKATHLIARGFKADNVAATLKLSQGKLDINGLSASLYGGTLAGTMSVDAMHDNALAAKVTLANVAVGPLLTDVAQQSALTGTGNVNADLKSGGGNTYAMKKQLAGSLSLQLRDGAIKGINVGQTLRELKSAILDAGKGGDAQVSADATRQTDFSQLDADVFFAAGIGTLKRLDAQSPLIRITQGSPATINLPDGSVDLVANVKISDAPPPDQDLGDLRGMAVPIQVTGPYDQLKYRVDWRALAADAVTRALQRTLNKALPGGKQDGKKGGLKDLGKVLKGITGK
jgi:AsmA protein